MTSNSLSIRGIEDENVVIEADKKTPAYSFYSGKMNMPVSNPHINNTVDLEESDVTDIASI